MTRTHQRTPLRLGPIELRVKPRQPVTVASERRPADPVRLSGSASAAV
jgi:hypothetical protein